MPVNSPLNLSITACTRVGVWEYSLRVEGSFELQVLIKVSGLIVFESASGSLIGAPCVWLPIAIFCVHYYQSGMFLL
jgi:hypothetical protein